jgi:hypothetical protein
MRRYLTAAFLILACLLADGRPAASQTPIRFPASGPHAFLVMVQPDWTSNEDRKHNGMQLFANGKWAGIFLSITSDRSFAGRPLLDFALEINKAGNIKHTGKEEPAAISGRPGTAFYGAMTNAKGAALYTRLVIVPLASDTWATLTTITPQSLSPAQQQSLDKAVSGIVLAK